MRVVPSPLATSGQHRLTLPADRRMALGAVDASFRDAVPGQDRALAERIVSVARQILPPGHWIPEEAPVDAHRGFAAMVVRGVLLKEILLAGRASADLLGPGDVFLPWEASETTLPCTTRWSTAGHVTIAILDGHFLAAARRWPGLHTVVQERLTDQLTRAGQRVALCSLPRVEARVLALFWQLADRWGTVRPEGIVIRLAMTHELLGRLVAAKRPTISLALTSLAADGLLARGADGAWMLSHGSLAVLSGDVDGPVVTGSER